MNNLDVTDGVLLAEYKTQGTELQRKMSQPNAQAILDDNAERRKNPGSVRSVEWGQLALRIPDLHYYELLKVWPELNSNDAVERAAAWEQLVNDPVAQAAWGPHERKRRGGLGLV